MKEINRRWKDIDGYPNYRVSDDGIVENKRTGRTLKHGDNNSGYPTVNLYNNGDRTTKSIHRIVAETFIDGFENDLEVNHKDGDKHNNFQDNLEWTTHSDNELHAYKIGLKHGPNRRPVKVVESGEVFESINECARAINGDDSHIGKCLSGKHKSHLGLTFEYADKSMVNAKADNSISLRYVKKRPYTAPIKIIETGETFSSIRECARSINGDQGTISGCLSGKHKTHKGYHFERVNTI